MSYLPFSIVLVVFSLFVIQYVLEVHIGSSISMYDGESGVVSENSLSKKSTLSQFFGKMVPLQLTAIGLPFLAYNFLSGVLLILIALFLFCLYRKKSSARAQRSTTN